MSYELKQVILFRADLNMRKGKIAAQVAHASCGVMWDALNEKTPEASRTLAIVDSWMVKDYPKIVLSVADEAALLTAALLALNAGIPHFVVTDLGHTEFHGVPTKTALALGPWKSEEIDKITGPGGLVTTKLA